MWGNPQANQWPGVKGKDHQILLCDWIQYLNLLLLVEVHVGKERCGGEGGSYSLDNCHATEELAPNRHQIISVLLYIPYSFMSIPLDKPSFPEVSHRFLGVSIVLLSYNLDLHYTLLLPGSRLIQYKKNGLQKFWSQLSHSTYPILLCLKAVFRIRIQILRNRILIQEQYVRKAAKIKIAFSAAN